MIDATDAAAWRARLAEHHARVPAVRLRVTPAGVAAVEAARERRVEGFVAMLARGETIHPQKRSPPTE